MATVFGDQRFLAYTGLKRDDELQQDHADYRQLSYLNGRWTSPDPYDGSIDFGNPQSLNRYSYVGNSPLLYKDPSGLRGDDGGDCICILCDLGGPIYGLIESFFTPRRLLGTTTPRPGLWDEHGGYKVKPFSGVGDLLGLNQSGCDFGACGSNFAPDHQTASGPNLYTSIISDAAWIWALHADRLHNTGPFKHGNWCGPGGTGNPTDKLDAACLQHDFCYFSNKLHAGDNVTHSNAALQGCNQALCDVAVAVLKAENHKGGNLDEGGAALNVNSYFSGFANIVRGANRCR